MKNIFKATTTVGIATVVTMFAGVLRSKFTAVTIGPAGVGIFSQAVTFFQLATTVTTLCIQLGMTRYIAKYNAEGDEESLRGVLSATAGLQLFASLLLASVIIAFSAPLGKLVFSSGAYAPLIAVAAVGIPLSTLAITFETTLIGFGDYKSFTKGRVAVGIASLVILCISIYTMRIRGGFIYLLLNACCAFLVFLFLLIRHIPGDLLRKAAVFKKSLIHQYKRAAGALLSYGGVSFVTTSLNLFSIVLLRSMLIRHFGAQGNGLYQVVFALSAYYLPFFTNGLWTYFYPKVSSLKESSRRYSVEVNHAIRFCLLGITPAVIAIFLAKKIFIRLIFSQSFLMAEQLFSTQLIGDVFYLLYYLLGTSLLATTRLKTYLFVGIANSLFLFVAFFLLRPAFGLQAITMAYLFSNMLCFLYFLGYHFTAMKVTLYMRNVILCVSSLLLIVLCLFWHTAGTLGFIWKAALVPVWCMLILTRGEKKRALSYMRRKLA